MVQRTTRQALAMLGGYAVLLGAAVQAAEPTASCTHVGGELAAMANADAALRGRLDYLAPPDDAEQLRRREQLALVERSNGERLRSLLARCGWPLRSVHGVQAGADAWKLVQHVGQDLALEKTVVEHLARAVRQGEGPARDLARLEDRIAVAEGRPQPYGTRMRQVATCRRDFHPMEDRAQVEERRRQAGLPTLAEQERMENGMVIHENCENRSHDPFATNYK